MTCPKCSGEMKGDGWFLRCVVCQHLHDTKGPAPKPRPVKERDAVRRVARVTPPREREFRADCSVDGCPNGVHVGRLCSAHYTRWLKYGDPLGTARTVRWPDPPPVVLARRPGDYCSLCGAPWAQCHGNAPWACPGGERRDPSDPPARPWVDAALAYGDAS